MVIPFCFCLSCFCLSYVSVVVSFHVLHFHPLTMNSITIILLTSRTFWTTQTIKWTEGKYDMIIDVWREPDTASGNYPDDNLLHSLYGPHVPIGHAHKRLPLRILNSDGGASHFMGVVMLKWIYSLIYRHLFHNLSLLEKVFLGHCASQDTVITRFGRYVKFASQPSALSVSSSFYTSLNMMIS